MTACNRMQGFHPEECRFHHNYFRGQLYFLNFVSDSNQTNKSSLMKKIYTTFLISVFAFAGFTQAQDVQWLTSTLINYSLNPALPQQLACASANRVYAARMVDYAL